MKKETILTRRQTVRGRYNPDDDFDKCAIRRKTHEFYTVHRQLETFESVKCDINFPVCKSLLLKICKEFGFKLKRSQTKWKVLIQKNATVEKRIHYSQRINITGRRVHRREVDPLCIYILYCNEMLATWSEGGFLEPTSHGQRLIIVHRGGKLGSALLIYKAKLFTGEYHHEMNDENFKKWLTKKKPLSNLPEKSVIIMDNASYHSFY